MKISDLHKDYYMFGGKGDVWFNTAHISKGSDVTTLCGKPMLSTNHCRIEKVEVIGCTECIKAYNNLFKD